MCGILQRQDQAAAAAEARSPGQQAQKRASMEARTATADWRDPRSEVLGDSERLSEVFGADCGFD